jgi:hypothetical protein
LHFVAAQWVERMNEGAGSFRGIRVHKIPVKMFAGPDSVPIGTGDTRRTLSRWQIVGTQ